MFTFADVDVTIKAEVDHIPVRGNATVSGDDDYDRQVEDAILERLEWGDVWAWASVTVTVTPKVLCKGLEGSAYLGCCSYEDEKDFVKNSGYYEDMVQEALEFLNREAEHLWEVLQVQKAKQVA